MTASVEVEMRHLIGELRLVDRKFASAVRKEIRAAVAVAGEELLTDIRSAASWSTRIPAATTVRPNFTIRSAGIRIVTSRARAPHARPYEMGNRSAPHSADTFTNGRGGVLPKRPFFFPTVTKATPEIEAKLLLAMDLACRQAGFR